MRRILLGLAAVIVLLLGVAVVRTLMLAPAGASATAPARQVTQVEPVDGNAVANHLADAVRFRTVSFGGGAHVAEKNEQLDAMRAWFEKTYPNFHRVATRSLFDKTLLYYWVGTNPDLKPVLLMAHMDVVPVVAGTEKDWQHAPFSGDISGGYVWGRGAIDDKGSLICILEAAERLAAQGFRPARTIMFAFGQDEEVGGSSGNKLMARVLAARGTHFAWVLDEGGSIQTEPYPGVHETIAFVSVAEKGYLSLELVAHGTGGHSSRPSNDLAIGRLADAVHAVVHHPFDSGLDDIQREKVSIIAPYTPFATRFVLGNMWLFSPFILSQMSAEPDAAARLHTTISPTIIDGGVKDNVLPPNARAVFNFRLHPRDTIASVVEHVKAAIADPKVDVNVLHETSAEASKISDMNGAPYAFLQKEIKDTFGDIPIAPDTTTGATDSRHYLPLSDAVFRLDPFHFGPNDLVRVHGTNERLAVSDLGQGVQFYMRLMKDVK